METTFAAALSRKNPHDRASRGGIARRDSGRRRFVDPATCERDYTQEEVDFAIAMHAKRQKCGIGKQLTVEEMLSTSVELGYSKPSNVCSHSGPSQEDIAEWQDAVLAYKERSGRKFPTFSELLEVLRELGYRKGNYEAPS